MGPHIKWKLKETLRALFAFYYGKLKLLHNSGLKWAQHGTKIDLNFRLTSCWFMTRLVCNFPGWVIGTGSQPANTACTPRTGRGVGDTSRRRALGQRPLPWTKAAVLLFSFPPPDSAWKRRAEKAEFHRRRLVLGSLNCSQKPFVNLLCLSGIN